MDTETLNLLMPAAVALGGVLLGWKLGDRSARRAATEERQWAERQTIRERQEVAAGEFDREVMRILSEVPRGVTPVRLAQDACLSAKTALRRAWSSHLVLSDPEITRRVDVLDMALLIGGRPPRGPDETVNLWSLEIAARDLREALGAFQRREPLPAARFPDMDELLKVVHSAGHNSDLEPVNEWLVERRIA